VGPKTTSKMRALGIETGADLRRQTLDFLQDRFGKSGSWYYNIAPARQDAFVRRFNAFAPDNDPTKHSM
jgi:DNA polymerase-4